MAAAPSPSESSAQSLWALSSLPAQTAGAVRLIIASAHTWLTRAMRSPDAHSRHQARASTGHLSMQTAQRARGCSIALQPASTRNTAQSIPTACTGTGEPSSFPVAFSHPRDDGLAPGHVQHGWSSSFPYTERSPASPCAVATTPPRGRTGISATGHPGPHHHLDGPCRRPLTRPSPGLGP